MTSVFQQIVRSWVVHCFGLDKANDIEERRRRFIEEALELVQSIGMSRISVHYMVDYIYDRPMGDISREIGGTMTTLAALCHTLNRDIDNEAWNELKLCIQRTDEIREKSLNKPVI